MLSVYLDGITLRGDSKHLVINAMGPLPHTCHNCGGSCVEVRRVLLRSEESSAIFFIWCHSCGKVSRIAEEFPIEWHRRVVEKVARQNQPVGGYCIIRAFFDGYEFISLKFL
jgi:hypothetical protein